MSWISGMITDVEQYFKNEVAIIKADAAPILANIGTEFRDALGNFMEAEYAAFKSIVASEFARVKAANPTASLVDLMKLAVAAALPALESGGIKVAEAALIQFVSGLLMTL